MNKMIMKAIGIVLALTVGIVSVTACGGTESNQSESTSGQVELVE